MAAQKKESGERGELALTISQAEALLRKGKPTQAEALLVKRLDAQPNNFDLLRLLGVASQFQRKNEEAAGYFSKAIKIDPASAQTHYNLGVTLSGLKRFDKAIENLRQALKIDPDDADTHCALGNAFAALNQHEDAVNSLRRALEMEPGNALMHIKMGMSLESLERHEQALSCFHNAIELNPGDAEIHNLLGIIQNKVSRLDEAVASFRRAIEIRPDHPQAHNSLGATLIGLKKHEEAVSSCRRAIEIGPDHAEAHNNLGTALNALKLHEEAIESFRRAIEIQPDHADAYNNLGIALNALKRHDEVFECYRRAIEINPSFADAHSNLGISLSYLNRYEEAIDSYRRAVEISPDHAEAHNNMVNALNALMRHAEAIECARRAIEINPHLGVAHSNLGNSLSCLKRHEEAVDCYRRAIGIRPDDADAHYNMGNELTFLKRYEEAIECYRHVIEIDPQIPLAPGYLAAASRMICDWSNFAETSNNLKNRVRQLEPVVYPFVFLSFSDDPEDQLHCARRYVEFKNFSSAHHCSPNNTAKDDRIRVAYVSADFGEHPVSYQIAELFERHDRDRFEIIGVSLGSDDNSPIGARLRQSFDRFIDVRSESDRSAAELIAKQNVHIAVDLNGYTQDSRSEIFAHRPAPIQVNYLGYPCTMGADFIDYIIVDSQIVPADQQVHFSERLVHLPDTYMVTDSTSAIAEETPSRGDVGLPQEGFVFCCFHKSDKITPDVFDVWLRLLADIPGSVLWLRIEDEVAMGNLRQVAAERNIDADRFVIAERVAMADHFARQRLADLFLDTLPYNAHSSASDALWAGLPVLTCSGKTFASRVAGSLLHAIELPELITESLEAYQALALKLAREPKLLENVRSKLARNRTTTALFNNKKFCHYLENAYTEMYETWRKGEAPKPIAINPAAP